MGKVRFAAVLCGSISVFAVAAVSPSTPAIAQAVQSYSFVIPSKSLLAALSDFTSTTGIQVVRPSSVRISGRSQALSGDYPADVALRALLAGSGLTFQFTGPRTVALHVPGGEEVNFAPGGDGIALEPIEVTSVGGNARAFQGVGKIEVGAEELALLNPTDLQGVFAAEAGVTVGGSLPMSQKVYVHGIDETNLAVTLDGARQNNKVFHHAGTNMIDPSLLKVARVDAGVAAADAGPGALAGSITYETKDARDLLEPGKNFGGYAKMQFDTNGGTVNPSASVYGQNDGFEFLGFINYANGDNYKDGAGAEVEGTGADFLSGLGKIAYQAESGDRFELSYEGALDDALRPFRGNIGSTNTNVPTPDPRRYTFNRKNIVFNYTDELPDGWWDPKAVIAYSVVNLDVPVPYGSLGETSSLNGKFENKFALPFGTVVAGIDFYDDKASYDGPTVSMWESATNVGVYAQARLEPWDRARLSFGIRGDQQWFESFKGTDVDNAGISGNISGEYDITDWLMAKAGASHIWAGIPLAENYLMDDSWDYSAGLTPVEADNVLAGLVVRYEGFAFEGGVFRTKIDNARSAGLWPGYSPLTTRDVESKGFELGAGYEWTDGFVRVKYANIDTTLDGVVTDSYWGNYLTTPVGEIIRVHFAHTFADWGLTVGGDATFALEYDKTAIDGNQALPAYQVLNLFAEYQPLSHPNFTLRAEVNNVFDELYSDRGTYGQEYLNFQPQREQGRSFLLSAKAQF